MRALVLACVLLVASVSGECSKAGKYDADGKIPLFGFGGRAGVVGDLTMLHGGTGVRDSAEGMRLGSSPKLSGRVLCSCLYGIASTPEELLQCGVSKAPWRAHRPGGMLGGGAWRVAERAWMIALCLRRARSTATLSGTPPSPWCCGLWHFMLSARFLLRGFRSLCHGLFVCGIELLVAHLPLRWFLFPFPITAFTRLLSRTAGSSVVVPAVTGAGAGASTDPDCNTTAKSELGEAGPVDAELSASKVAAIKAETLKVLEVRPAPPPCVT